MKLPTSSSGSNQAAAQTAAKGFTLTEMLIAVTVFLLVISAVLSANLFGLRIFQIAENKLTATDSARKTVGKITDEIRNCSTAYVGNISNGVFVALSTGAPQKGSGLLIYPTTNTANFVIYFLNASDQTFRRTTSAPGTTAILARAVTNTLVFSAQDCLGNVLTNSQNNRVIQLNLAFFQPQRFGTVADCYKLETAVTRRAL
jgi:prepilin-type N-terminal cleavage/methylation domain-containing protein